jgi:hypothetical protein
VIPDHVATATALYRTVFPWGIGPGEVAFHTPAGEGASGGPAAFTADAAGNIVLLDHSNSRLVRRRAGSPSTVPIALPSPAVTAAAFDAQGRVVVASLFDIAVFDPTGHVLVSWTPVSHTGTTVRGIYGLEVDGDRVYSVDYSFINNRTRRLVLRDSGSGYAVVQNAPTEADAIVAHEVADLNYGVIDITAAKTQYRITTGLKDLRSVRFRPDGSLVFILGNVQSDSGHPEPQPYVLARIDPNGDAHYGAITASTGYLNGGPVFDITDDGVAVMGSTTAGGVTVSYYRF